MNNIYRCTLPFADFLESKILTRQQPMVHHRKYPRCSFDPDLGVKIKQNVVQYILHHITYRPTSFEIAMANRLRGDGLQEHSLIFLLGVKVIRNATLKLLRNVLGGALFTRKYII